MFNQDNFWERVVNIMALFGLFIWDNITKLSIWAFGLYLIPTMEMICVIIFFVIMELYTSIHKMKYFKEWNSKKIKRDRYIETVNKLILYTVGIFSTYVLQHHITKDMVQVMYIFVALISVRELEKIMSNIEKVTGVKVWLYVKKHLNHFLKFNDETTEKKEEKEEN